MSRGNQREIDRKRAAARTAKAGAGKKDDGLTPAQRNERCAMTHKLHPASSIEHRACCVCLTDLVSRLALHVLVPDKAAVLTFRDKKALEEKQAKKAAAKDAGK
jgi:4F5 protein related disordered region